MKKAANAKTFVVKAEVVAKPFPPSKPVELNGIGRRRPSYEDIGIGGKPVSSSGGGGTELADQRPITFRELDVRISWQYCILYRFHGGENVRIFFKGR